MEFENDRGAGIIKLRNETKEVGRLTYHVYAKEHKLTISFVLVYSEFEGRGLGRYLVEEAVRFARENNWKVYPQCSYARAVMMRMNDVDDVFLR